MSEESRRFTDREVALVLRKASEIEEEVGTGDARGLSLRDLEEIAREVGISDESIARAVAGLDQSGRRATRRLRDAAPAAHKAVHAVSGELSDAALNRLLHLVDERMESAGAISEALGSVRWTASDRFGSTQVALTPHDGETTIQVSEKLLPRWKRVLHGIPAAWGAMIGGLIVQTIEAPALNGILILVISVLIGLGLGRFLWSALSGRSEKRVQRLAADLSREAYNAARSGMLAAPEADEG